MRDLFAIEEADWEMAQRGLPADSEEREWVARMAQGYAGSGSDADRLPWEDDFYTVALIDVQPRDNRASKYYDEAKPWTAEKFDFKFEVLEGDKQGDYLFRNFLSRAVWRNKQGEWEGAPAGLLDIMRAIEPDFDPASVLEDGDEAHFIAFDVADMDRFKGIPLIASVKPKEGGKYADVADWKRVKKGYKAPAPKPAESFTPPSADDADIPF